MVKLVKLVPILLTRWCLSALSEYDSRAGQTVWRHL